MNKLYRRLMLISLPVMAGFAVFWLVPFGKTLYYSFIDNTHRRNFVGFKNYISLFGNKYFRLALKNTAVFSVISVASVMLVSVVTAYFLELRPFFRGAFVLPVLMPTTAVIYVWELFFGTSFYEFLRSGRMGSLFTVLPLYLLYIWKNTGFAVIIISAALGGTDREIKEAAALDGAGRTRIFTCISLPCIKNELFFAMMLSFVSSLKIYRESSLLYEAEYPPDEIYMLQNFMNNHFHKLNYQVLTAATAVFVLFMSVFVILIFRRTSPDFTPKRRLHSEENS